jgi:hypothetical protein
MHQIWEELPVQEQLQVWILHSMGLLTHERDEAMKEANHRIGIEPLPTVTVSDKLYLARSNSIFDGAHAGGKSPS